MRVRPLYIPMLFLFLACWRADASSHPVAAKPVTTHSHEHEAVRGKEASRTTKGNSAASGRHATATKATPQKAQLSTHPKTTALSRTSSKKPHREVARESARESMRESAKASMKPHAVERATPTPVREAARELKDAPEESVEPPAEETVHVTHDRKVHHSAEQTPRKATPEDFMPDPVEAAPVKVTDPPKPSARTKPAPDLAKPDRAKPAQEAVAGLAKVTSAQPANKTIAKAAPEPTPVPMPALYTKSGKLIVPAALKGSHEILLHQNEVADLEGLSRVQDDADLENLRETHMIVPLPRAQGLLINEGLPENRRYCRPWAAQFLIAMAKAHYARFHRPLQVNSAVRTVEVQERLLRTNGNAAPAEGETASPHLTGQAVDLAKKGLSITEIAWLRGYLLPLVQQGKVDVEEEFQQSCFHISVYKKYLPQPAPKREIASSGHSPVTAMASAVR